MPFGPATAMTGDGPAIHDLYMLTGNKWSNTDVELECGSGVLPFNYLKANAVHSIQWAMGLELLLMVKDPWKTIMTTDSPNGGPFTKYPQVITWLMSKKAREATFAECHKWAHDKTSLGAVDREMTLYEIAIITRANPARTVGLTHRKGHLGAGADGDVTIYDFDPTKFDVNDHTGILKGFQNAAYTIKDGGVVAQNGQIISVPQGRTFFTEAHIDDSLEKEMLKDVKEWFKYYTLGYANYPVPDKYLRNPAPVQVNKPLEAIVRR